MRNQVLELLQKEIDLQHIPGAVVHISHRGETLLQAAVGNRTVYPSKSPMTVDTVFDLASLTKVVATTPAILKLIESGEARLDDPVAHFLPRFSSKGKEHIKLRHLLTHTSGLPAHRRYHLNNFNTTEILNRIYEEERESPVGRKIVYTDSGFILLYKIIETITGQLFTEYVQERLFRPLEMNETGFNPTFGKNRYAATEYCEKLQDYKQGIVHDEDTVMMGGISGHAGLFSTIKDLQNFALMIENRGIFKERRVLSEAALEQSTTNYTLFDNEYRGLGWMMKSPTLAPCGDLFSPISYGHTGFTGTSIWFEPEERLHVILLTNRVHYGRQSHMLRLRPRLHNIIRSYF